MHVEQYYLLKRVATVADIAVDALVVDESSSLLWFSFRAKVGTNFDPGARFMFCCTCLFCRVLNVFSSFLLDCFLVELV